MSDELRKTAQALIAEWDGDVSMNRLLNRVEDMRNVLAKPVAAPQDATDWEAVSADQAMTIAMLRVDYQQLQALVTSQGIALMEQEEWQKDAARWRYVCSAQGLWTPDEYTALVDEAMEQKP